MKNVPPFLVSFSDVSELLRCSPDPKNSNVSDGHEKLLFLNQEKLPPVISVTQLATIFGFSPRFLISMSQNSSHYYRIFSVRKGRKIRKIQSPKISLKIIQKWFAHHLANAVEFHPSVHGFIRRSSHISAAKVHCNATWVYSIDIKDFFLTTPQEKVEASLQTLGYGNIGAKILASLFCYKGVLAQGAPSSPILSNLVFNDLDQKIDAHARKLGVRYTRYADDLVFSGENSFPEEVKLIKAWIEAAGWQLSEQKEHLSELPNRLKVHGLLVHSSKVNLTKGYRNRIRLFEFLKKKGITSNSKYSENIISGHLAYQDLVLKHCQPES